jgi:hypothetical protein
MHDMPTPSKSLQFTIKFKFPSLSLFSPSLARPLHEYLELVHDIFEKRLGTFYRYTSKEQFVPLKRNVGISNGLTWNEKTNKFYFIDSVDLDVKEYDYDPVGGNLCKFKTTHTCLCMNILNLCSAFHPHVCNK